MAVETAECSHPSGKHPYHTILRHEDGEKAYEDIDCGYCGKSVRTLRVK